VDEHRFKLLGRSSNLAKIAGKRISTQQIENLIELENGIDAVLIKIRKDERALKDEILEIYIEGSKEIKAKELKEILKKSFGSVHIPFKVHNNMHILRSSVGKKIGFSPPIHGDLVFSDAIRNAKKRGTDVILASEIANELGNVKLANMVMLGALLMIAGIFSLCSQQ
jgi:Pyruvate/2-oxoacid:ferredoxin oxidoreductase gamma subunit